MQTSMACKPWRFLVQLPSDSRRFPPASLRETRETPVHFHAKPRHFPRKPPQFPLRAHAVPPLPSVDSHRNAPRTRACASSNSATEPTFSAHQRNARDNKPMQLSTTAIPAHEKGAREPLTLYYLVFVFTVCSILGLILETVVSYFVDGRWESRVGFIWGPFSPIYGVGGVLITLRCTASRTPRRLSSMRCRPHSARRSNISPRGFGKALSALWPGAISTNPSI